MMKGTTILVPCAMLLSEASVLVAGEPIDIGERRELFIDDYLIDSTKAVNLVMHEPQRQNVAITFDQPWEGTFASYIAILKEKNLYRMYYNNWYDQSVRKIAYNIAYAESADGITFQRPKLKLFEIDGTRDNNVVLADILGRPEASDLAAFLDTNPNVTLDAKYKAVGARHYATLCAFKSPDGIHWSVMGGKPLDLPGWFDTQNIAFWSEHEKKYVLYYRVGADDDGNMYSCEPARNAKHALQRRNAWQEDKNLKRFAVLKNNGPKENRTYPVLDPVTGVPIHYRQIARAVSDDFVNWKREGLIEFPGGGGSGQQGQLYTNCIRPYYRAPHIYIGFPGRYTDRGTTASTFELPQPELRKKRPGRRATAVTDSVLIHSRDGIRFHHHDGAFVRPGARTKYNWSYHDNFVAWHVVETQPTDEDSFPELSLYASEGSWSTPRIRRYTLRIDGFVSAKAKTKQGELLTKPFTFDGNRLSLNVATSGFGWVKVELQDAQGKPIEGYTLDDANMIYGDSLDRTVGWQGKKDVSKLAGKPIRMRFVMREADLYSFKFEKDQ